LRTRKTLSIAKNDSIFIDAGPFKVMLGKAKGEASAQIKKLGARELGEGEPPARTAPMALVVFHRPAQLAADPRAAAGRNP
jgi:hypothetical protein